MTLETHLPLLTLNEHTCIYYSCVYTIAWSRTSNIDHHDIAKILFKVALNTITLTPAIKWKTKNATLSEQFQNLTDKL
jgi:hypothetical protein